MSETPSAITTEPPVSHEHLAFKEGLVGLQVRLLINGDALNHEVQLSQIDEKMFHPLAERITKPNGAYSLLNHASINERKEWWQRQEIQGFDEQKKAWVEQTTATFQNAQRFFETSDKGKLWKQAFARININTHEFTQTQAEQLYSVFFASQAQETGVQRFIATILQSYQTAEFTIDYQRLHEDLPAWQWLAGIFGDKSSQVIAQLTEAEAKLKTQPQVLIEGANQVTSSNGQETLRVNNLTEKEKELLTFLLPDGQAQTTIKPIPTPTQPPEGETKPVIEKRRLKAKEILEKGFTPDADPPVRILKDQIDRAAEHFKQQGTTSPQDLVLALSKNFFSVSLYQRIVEQQMFGPKEFERAENIQEANAHIANIRTGLANIEQAAPKDGFSVEPDLPWLHYKSPEYQKKHENTTYRIYLNPNYEHYPAMVQALIDWGKTNPLYFKITDTQSPYDLWRLDKIVIYLSDDNVDQVLDFITIHAKTHPEIFQGKAVPGSSGVIIGDGIGLAYQDREKNPATGHGKTGGQINAQRIDQAMRERLNAQVLDAFSKYPNEADFLVSPEAQYFREVYLDSRMWPKEISSDQMKSILAESMLKAVYRGKTGITKDKFDTDVLLPDQTQLKSIYAEGLTRAGNQQAADRIKSMSVSEFEKIFYLQNYISEGQLQRVGFAMELHTVLAQGKKPGEFFTGLVFGKSK